jgi:hypothetical protein
MLDEGVLAKQVLFQLSYKNALLVEVQSEGSPTGRESHLAQNPSDLR